MGVLLGTKNILRLSARDRGEVGLELSGRSALGRRGPGQAQTHAGKLGRQRAQIYPAGHSDDRGALSSGKQRLEFKISDTGVGIPEENIPKIFEKFRQGERHTGMEHGGVGLGLYIVKKYLDLLGGNIEVQSRVGEGTTFIFKFPRLCTAMPRRMSNFYCRAASESFGADSR